MLKRIKLEELNEEDRHLLDRAREAISKSYAPYSNFRVGASVRLANGGTVQGANRELLISCRHLRRTLHAMYRTERIPWRTRRSPRSRPPSTATACTALNRSLRAACADRLWWRSSNVTSALCASLWEDATRRL